MFEASEKHRLASWRDYAQRWRDHVGPFFGGNSAEAIRIEHVDRYRSLRLAQKARAPSGRETKRSVSIATINREIALLRRLLGWGRRRGYLIVSHLHGAGMTRDLIHEENNVRTTVIEDDPREVLSLDAFLSAARRPFRGYLMLMARSGGRREELAMSRWDRISRASGLLWVPDADTKGRRGGRYLPIDPETLSELDGYRRVKGNPFIFPSPVKTGWHLHRDWFTRQFGKLCRELGLTGPDGPPWLHDLRRSFVTLSRRRGIDTTEIMKITGHKSTHVFQRYNVFSAVDVIATKRRLEQARRDELAAIYGTPVSVDELDNLSDGDRHGPHRGIASPKKVNTKITANS